MKPKQMVDITRKLLFSFLTHAKYKDQNFGNITKKRLILGFSKLIYPCRWVLHIIFVVVKDANET